MLTAWIVCSTLLGLCGMFGELRKGSSVATAVAGGVCTFVLWPVLLFWVIMSAVIIWTYVLVTNIWF